MYWGYNSQQAWLNLFSKNSGKIKAKQFFFYIETDSISFPSEKSAQKHVAIMNLYEKRIVSLPFPRSEHLHISLNTDFLFYSPCRSQRLSEAQSVLMFMPQHYYTEHESPSQNAEFNQCILHFEKVQWVQPQNERSGEVGHN